MALPLKIASCFGVLEYWKKRNCKSQIPNIKWFDKLTTLSLVEGQITMTEIQNPKQKNIVFSRFEFCDLFVIWCLEFVILDTKLQGKASISDPRIAGSLTGLEDQVFN